MVNQLTLHHKEMPIENHPIDEKRLTISGRKQSFAAVNLRVSRDNFSRFLLGCMKV